MLNFRDCTAHSFAARACPRFPASDFPQRSVTLGLKYLVGLTLPLTLHLQSNTSLAKIENGATVYCHQDGLSARLMTDSSGNVLSQQGHYPFGESWYQTGSATTDQQFTSYQRDTESGNDYALAREFVNRLGRFSALDPLTGNIANPQSLNRYAYAANDPIDLLDPEGEYLCYTYCGGGDPYGFWTGGGTPMRRGLFWMPATQGDALLTEAGHPVALPMACSAHPEAVPSNAQGMFVVILATPRFISKVNKWLATGRR